MTDFHDRLASLCGPEINAAMRANNTDRAADMTDWNDTPCDKCGKDTGCTCRWCRYDRGEGPAAERALVEANIRAHKMANRRQADRKVQP